MKKITWAGLILSLACATAPAATNKADVAGDAMPQEPGAHKRVPCPDNPKLTVDVYVPKAYAEKPAARLPVLFISSPSRNPGFRGLESWAEAQEVVLVGINESKNGDWAPIIAAQEAAWNALKPMRIHPCLRFATGFSGGGCASAEFAKRHPKDFAGVVLQCHSGFDAKTPGHIAAGFIGGIKDTTHPDSAVRGAAAEARRSGHYVQEEHPDRGHAWAPTPMVARMLTNQLTVARLTHPGIPEKERKAALEEIGKTLTALRENPADEAGRAKLDALLDPEELKSKPFRAPALELWCAARLHSLEALTGREAMRACTEPTTDARFAECRGKPRAAFDAFRKKLEADPELKGEFAAWREYERLRDALAKAARANAKPKELAALRDKLAALAKKSPGTLAAERCAETAGA